MNIEVIMIECSQYGVSWTEVGLVCCYWVETVYWILMVASVLFIWLPLTRDLYNPIFDWVIELTKKCRNVFCCCFVLLLTKLIINQQHRSDCFVHWIVSFFFSRRIMAAATIKPPDVSQSLFDKKKYFKPNNKIILFYI